MRGEAPVLRGVEIQVSAAQRQQQRLQQHPALSERQSPSLVYLCTTCFPAHTPIETELGQLYVVSLVARMYA